MKTAVIVFLLASVCIQSSTPSKVNIRRKRAWIMDSLSMEEELKGPFPFKVGDLNLEKHVTREYFIHGQGIDKDPKGVIFVQKDGSVYALGKVDYEEYKKLTITLTKKNTSVVVEIKVLDVNDHAPVFEKDVYEISVHESTAQGEHLVTALANDNDQSGTVNSQFTMRIVSVSPSTSSVQFFIDQPEGDVQGKISFKGCLDYEEAQKYTILVEAKDHGEKVQLSSTSTVIVNIIDTNNHLPEITGMTECGDGVCRLHVSDRDSRGSDAWRATYSLQGEKADHFKIETDPETNDGVITLMKPLNSEEMSGLHLSVSVRNDKPFFYCKVKGRPKHGLWHVDYTKGRSSFTSMSFPISSIAKDASDPPAFMKQVGVMKRMETGPMLEVDKVGMCLSEKTANITALNPDLYNRSFLFELMGDVEGKWRLQSNYGASVRLIKESRVQTGDHELSFNISDSKGQYSLQTLSVHVCDCEVVQDCSERRDSIIQINMTVVVPVTVSFLVLLGILLMACRIKRTAKKSERRENSDEAQDQFLSRDSLETDCMKAMFLKRHEPQLDCVCCQIPDEQMKDVEKRTLSPHYTSYCVLLHCE